MAFQLRLSVTFVDQEIFTSKIIRVKIFVVYFHGLFHLQNFLTVDGYNMNENQVSLAVMLWLSGVVVDWVFISGDVDVCAETYLLIIAA